MKQIKTVLICLLATTSVLASDINDIKSAFWGYIEAAVQSDGNKAVLIFSEAGFDYWDKLLARAKTDNKSTIQSLPTYQIFNTLLIRERARSDKKILSMTGEDWIKHSYSSGWNSNKALNTVASNRELFELSPEVNGATADIVLKYNGKPLPTTFPFIKEDDGWKIDGEKQFLQLEINIENKRKEAGISKEEYCNAMFRALFQKNITSDLWSPQKK